MPGAIIEVAGITHGVGSFPAEADRALPGAGRNGGGGGLHVLIGEQQGWSRTHGLGLQYSWVGTGFWLTV